MAQITVIVPCFNEENYIEDCIRALSRQTVPDEDYEIVVVDNGSTDETVRVIESMNVRWFHQPLRSPYLARNLGVEKTESDFVALTDAQCLAEPTWLAEMVSKAKSEGAWIVGGLTKFEVRQRTLGNQLYKDSHQPDQLRDAIEQYGCVAGNNMLIHRMAFEKFGLFKPIRSGSDIEFSKRLARGGHPPVFAQKAVVRRQCDLSNWDYLKRCYRIRRGQRMHSTKPTGALAGVKHLAAIPWRPGLRAVKTVGGKANGGFVAEWLYRWATRWAGFLGELHGLFAAKSAE